MDERARAENEALKAMFETDGWAVLSRRMREDMEALQKTMPGSISNEKALHVAQGYFQALLQLLAQPDLVSVSEENDYENAAP